MRDGGSRFCNNEGSFAAHDHAAAVERARDAQGLGEPRVARLERMGHHRVPDHEQLGAKPQHLQAKLHAAHEHALLLHMAQEFELYGFAE